MSLAGEERKREIMTLLNEKGKVIAGELAQRFEVSTETIRRDLDDLEKENKLKKVYGGALRISPKVEPPLLERESTNVEAKLKVGALAAKLVEDNDVIVLDEGSTVLQMIPFLEHKRNLTILTNSIPALMRLLEYQKRGTFDVKIILIGGVVNTQHLRATGPIAEKIIEDFYVNKAFISVDGVSLKHGITSYDYEKAVFTRKLIGGSEMAIVVADYSKIAKRTVARIAELRELHTIVSDEAPPEEWKSQLGKLELRWIHRESDL
ncbi:DeoR/GlpR transcriptional regulator [Cohnella sp. LGH]|uniref:DeoR/GlpR family DNA-binding transcription regulator n=1 Tax=Cohnella sp. LGH TaxID=1619153 RepID=UPI001ADBE139|nr:DeoR/GlpR family DNA-binding transcription regulator [Cohnella sp. LGH]QTH41496.1 DeoR/GlpR transcriptional regulator [Cohnella sp. LGH]